MPYVQKGASRSSATSTGSSARWTSRGGARTWYICVYIHIYTYLDLSLSIYIYVYVYLSVYVIIYIYIYIYIYHIYTSISLSLYLSLSLYTYIYILYIYIYNIRTAQTPPKDLVDPRLVLVLDYIEDPRSVFIISNRKTSN